MSPFLLSFRRNCLLLAAARDVAAVAAAAVSAAVSAAVAPSVAAAGARLRERPLAGCPRGKCRVSLPTGLSPLYNRLCCCSCSLSPGTATTAATAAGDRGDGATALFYCVAASRAYTRIARELHGGMCLSLPFIFKMLSLSFIFSFFSLESFFFLSRLSLSSPAA